MSWSECQVVRKLAIPARVCDQLRPWCRRCTRAGLSCGGYERPPIFVNRTQDGHSALPSRSYSPPRALDQIAVSTPLLDLSLERTAAESRYLFLYWRFLLPNNGQMFSLQATRHSTTGWIQVVQDLAKNDKGVRAGLLANALALVGQQMKQLSVVMEAFHMYSKALQILARCLPHIKQEQTTEEPRLMTSALLAAFELLQVSNGRQSCLHGITWLRHSTGQKAIILARGPESYKEGIAHQLFADGRLHLIYPEIHNRKRSAFDTQGWKSIPWSTVPKTPKDELVDILLEIPGLLEDLEREPADATQQESLHKQLQERCRICREDLRNWCNSLGDASVSFAEGLISIPATQDSSLSPKDFAMAHLGMIYWATCSLLYQIMADDTTAWLYCRKVLLMVPFFQRPDMGAIFINFVGFPVSVVVSFVARQEHAAFETSKELLYRIFTDPSHGSQLRAFFETWPWQSANETRVVMNRAKPRTK
ncbi:hypothetical protein FVEG_12582 [Fusarium verticillioides 7600]|uniref:Zn(2)-C6 fungal-type domain-containing protein n=1 Tax=Gibberella moniliformis (strain M3125 / FGSC 7600) TaxID=334819 RepID=W7NCU9_GIBM7|nr:hypothetical protein FVEG_12582 [Fusarium verticillioides 7600]EWG54342.1 hypothetical protein FVEG_12582 [Fusarium verticillioides 7600]